jgi:hypothetical protein
MERDSFIFYRSFFEALQNTPEAERLRIYDAICLYSFDNKEPELSGMELAIFKLMRPVMDANRRNFENGKKGAVYGSKGGRPKKETPPEPPNNPDKTPPEPPNKVKDKDKNTPPISPGWG